MSGTENNRGTDRRSLPFPSLEKHRAGRRKIKLQKRGENDCSFAPIPNLPTSVAVQRFEIVEVAQAQRPLQLGDFVSYRFLRNQTAFLASFVLHLFLLTVLSLLLIQVGMGRAAIVLEALIPQPPDDLLDLSFIPTDEADLENDLQDDNSNPLLAASQVVFHGLSEPLSTHVEKVAGKKSGAATAGNAAEFFGTRVNGHSFVYVLDRSQSMGNDSQGKYSISAEAFTRFDAASEELLRSVGQLTEDQEFYVVLFSTKTTRMFDDSSARPKPLKATEENKRKLATWLRRTRVGGGTDPGDSLQLALKIQPDAIFMLSDGEFGRNVPGSSDAAMQVVRNQNSGNVAIHTVALEDESSKRNMRQIASMTGGEFRFVSLNQSLTNILRGSDVQSRTTAYRRLPAITSIVWQDRIKIARQAIADLQTDDPQLQNAAEVALHFLSFDIFKPGKKEPDSSDQSPPWTIPSIASIGAEIDPIASAWNSAWQNGCILQQKLASPTPADNSAAEQDAFETRLLVAYGDFLNHHSLATATSQGGQQMPVGQQTFLAQSLLKFRDHYTDADLFVGLSSPNPKTQSAALQTLIGKKGIELSWKDRYQIATEFAIPLLHSSDPELQVAAESALHFLSFQLFDKQIATLQDPADSDKMPSKLHDPQNVIDLWHDVWICSDQLQHDRSQLTSLETADFEQQLLAYLGDYPRTQDINALSQLSSSDVSILKQIAVANALINFQHQFGTTQESSDLLRTLCNGLYPQRKNTKKFWDAQVSSESWRLRLKNALRQRQAAARRMYGSWKKLDVTNVRKAALAERLIDRYPETEYAAMVRPANQP